MSKAQKSVKLNVSVIQPGKKKGETITIPKGSVISGPVEEMDELIRRGAGEETAAAVAAAASAPAKAPLTGEALVEAGIAVLADKKLDPENEDHFTTSGLPQVRELEAAIAAANPDRSVDLTGSIREKIWTEFQKRNPDLFK